MTCAVCNKEIVDGPTWSEGEWNLHIWCVDAICAVIVRMLDGERVSVQLSSMIFEQARLHLLRTGGVAL